MTEKLTQNQLAEYYQVGIATIRRAKADGVDIHDRDAFAAHIRTKKKYPPAWVNGPPWEQDEQPNTEQYELTDEERELMQQVRDAPNYDVARTLKTKIDSLMGIKKMAILDGDYVHRDEVKADLTRIGAAVAAAHRQCQADLPAMLEGLSAAQSKVKIREYMLRIDGMLADESSKLHKNAVS